MLLIEKLRTDNKLSQSEIARRAVMHVSTVNSIERGRLIPWPGQIEKLKGIMLALGWDGVSDLFSEVSE